MNGQQENPEARRRATIVPSERDTRSSARLIEQLIFQWRRDAGLVGAGAGAGSLLASSGEAAEFGLMNAEKAQELYAESIGHDDADARAFAGLRRLARDENDADGVLDAYRKEAKLATSPTQAVTAGVGLAQVMIRLGRRADLAERVLRDLEPLIAHVGHEIIAVYRATLEDVLVVAGRPSQALQLRVQRWGELRGLGDGADDWAVDAALAIVAASEAIGSRDDAILEWYEVIFELSRSAEALRPLLRAQLGVRRSLRLREPCVTAVPERSCHPQHRGSSTHTLCLSANDLVDGHSLVSPPCWL